MEPTPPLLPRDHLYLIDTMGYIFRAFHALPPLTNSRGMPTQAVLGFVNMLRKLLQEVRPDAIVAVFDVAGPTFRDENFAAYKANRAPMPETLATQLPWIRRALQAFCIPILEFPGFEADDVIGTIAKQAAAGGVIIVSSDKDLLQLVGGGVRVFNPSRNLLLDSAEVVAKLGVRPDQVADLLALRGDAVDNIPGAPGIGEKGAQQLIERFGTVEQALERAAEVERKTYRESLQNYRDQILLSKALATIHTEVPVPFAPDAWRARSPDIEACRVLYAELEFHHLLQALPGGESPSTASPSLPPSQVADAETLRRFLEETALMPVAMAFADIGGDLGLAHGDASPWLVASDATPQLALELADATRRWQWHDTKAARAQLRQRGLPLPPLDPDHIEDLSLLAYLDDSTRGSYAFDAFAQRAGIPVGSAPDPGQTAAGLAGLLPTLRRRVEESGQWSVYRDLDLPLVEVLEAMETAGVKLDPAPLADLSLDLERRCLACQEEVFALAEVRFNLNSPQQLADVLFTRMGLPPPPRRGKTKALSTAMDVLEDLAEHPAAAAIVRPILEFRQLSKLKSTYVDALPPLINPATGRVHTTFTLAGSATGRLASSNPNLQNIPIRTELGRQIRAAFVPEPGYVLLAGDYSQIELRLLAHFSQDPLLLEAYRGGEDIHRLTAAEVFGVPPLMIGDEHRRRAKAVNFGIVYGLSAFGLARQLSIPQSEAAHFIRRYFERYAGVKAYIERELEAARRTGQVKTFFGRVRPIPNLDARNPTLRGFAERTAINTPLQGTAADLIKLAMIRLYPQLPSLDARLLLQVHDELVLEVPAQRVAELARTVRAVMENVVQLSVPLRVEIGFGLNWRDLEAEDS